MDCDLALSGGTVIDGTGAPRFAADVAVRDGGVVAVGDLGPLLARKTIDCRGRVVAPCFIDLHSHSDWLVPGANAAKLVEPFLRQRMTTFVGGNCGFSPAPITARNRTAAEDSSPLVVDDVLELRWETMEKFPDALEGVPLPPNVGEPVGHGTVRSAVTGMLSPAAPGAAELTEMEGLVRAALDAGCLGVSTGLGYAPGIFAGEDELAAFARWSTASGKFFTSHLRAYSRVSPVYGTDPGATPHNVAAIEEILRVARAGRAKLQISHLIFVGRRTWPTCAGHRHDRAHARRRPRRRLRRLPLHSREHHRRRAPPTRDAAPSREGPLRSAGDGGRREGARAPGLRGDRLLPRGHPDHARQRPG